MKLTLLMAALATFLLAACGNTGGPGKEKAQVKSTCADLKLAQLQTASTAGAQGQVLQNIADQVILREYNDLCVQAQSLHLAALTLKDQPNQANLDKTQAAWRAARVPWEASEAFLFGPVNSLALDDQLDSWPLPTLQLAETLRSRPNADAAFVRNQPNNLKGFHAIEYLLFGDGVASNNKAASQLTPAELNYLTGATQVLLENVATLYSAWAEHHDPSDPRSQSYASTFRSPNINNPHYQTYGGAYSHVISSLIKILTEVSDGKLDVKERAKVESQFSWNSLEDFQNNIRSALYIYSGGVGVEKQGLDLFVLNAGRADVHARVRQALDSAIQAIAAIAGPNHVSFPEAIETTDGRQRIEAARHELANLSTIFEREVKPLLPR